ncbi:MAG TPA: hypothetical protein VIK99_05735 [Thermaerobacter sp.]
MQTCEVCYLEPHSETARTLMARCHECGRQACPDCQRHLVNQAGVPVGTYCTACAETIARTFRSVGEEAVFVQPYAGRVDAAGRPVLRSDPSIRG